MPGAGTPLQNNLSELWSLLNFLLPDIFTSSAQFESWFEFGNVMAASEDLEARAAEQRSLVINKLHGILKPFLLRRMKADVEIALPRKQEIVLYVPMSDVQKKLNQQLLEKTLTVSAPAVEGGTVDGIHFCRGWKGNDVYICHAWK
jgi:ATP-dependent DNA helicase